MEFTIIALSIIIFLLLLSNWAMWKTGSIDEAENPKPVLDKPIMDAKERKAFFKRLRRWREEGKVSAAEFETLSRLCDEEWDS